MSASDRRSPCRCNSRGAARTGASRRPDGRRDRPFARDDACHRRQRAPAGRVAARRRRDDAGRGARARGDERGRARRARRRRRRAPTPSTSRRSRSRELTRHRRPARRATAGRPPTRSTSCSTASTKISAAVEFVEDVSHQHEPARAQRLDRSGARGRARPRLRRRRARDAQARRVDAHRDDRDERAAARDRAKAGAATERRARHRRRGRARRRRVGAGGSGARVDRVGGRQRRRRRSTASTTRSPAQASRTEELERASHGVLDISRSHHTAAAESTAVGERARAPRQAARDRRRRDAASYARRSVLRVATILNDSPSSAAWQRFQTLVRERTGGAVARRARHPVHRQRARRGQRVRRPASAASSRSRRSAAPSRGNVIPAAQLFELPYLFDSAEHAFAVLDSRGRPGRARRSGGGRPARVRLPRERHAALHQRGAADPHAGRRARAAPARDGSAGVPALRRRRSARSRRPCRTSSCPTRCESGEAQAQENPLTNIRGLDLPRVQRYLTLSAHSYTPQIVFAQPGGDGSARRADRAAVEAALHETMAWHRGRAREMERDALSWLRARMEVVELDATRARSVPRGDRARRRAHRPPRRRRPLRELARRGGLAAPEPRHAVRTCVTRRNAAGATAAAASSRSSSTAASANGAGQRARSSNGCARFSACRR